LPFQVTVKKRSSTLPRFFSVVLTATGYFIYFISAVGFVGIISPFLLLSGFLPNKQHRLARITLQSFLFFLIRQLLPFLRVYSIARIAGFNQDSPSAGIYVSNHRGRLDALLLLSIMQDTGVLIKSKYCRFPLYRMFVKYLDFISIDAKTPAGLGDAMDRCKNLLHTGMNILVFPEGTRASTGRLLPFKSFAFRLAINTGLPVIPLIVHSDCPFMAKRPGSIFPKETFRYTIRCLDPMLALPEERPADFAGRVRSRIAEELAPLDRGTVWEV